MATCAIFEEDEVCVTGTRGHKCGLVIESSEYISSDDEDPPPDFDIVRKGTVRVAWHPDGEEEVIAEQNVKLADRSLMPGDVVRRLIEGQDSQRGYVRNTRVNCHLQVIGQNKVICNVDSKFLEAQQYWDTEPGDVTLDCWVGKIESINDTITLKFPDGARCRLNEEDGDIYNFDDVHEKRERHAEFYNGNYYPGQQLKGLLRDLQHAEWLKSTKNHGPETAQKNENVFVTAVVEEVEPKSMEVHWLCRGYSKVENPLARMDPPPRTLTRDHIKRLKKLDCFEPCSVQIGDKAFYTVRDTDVIHTVHKHYKSVLNHIMKEKLDQVQSVANGPCSDTAGVDGVHASGGTDANCLSNGPDLGETDSIEDREDLQNGNCNSEGNNDNEAGEEHDSEYEDEDGDDDDDDASVTSNHSNTSSPSLQKKKPKKAVLKTRLMKKKGRRAKRKIETAGPLPGERIAVEVMYTFSLIEVMWQDLTVEKDVPSIELYPIHHLDELEFFPGDFVVENGDSEGVTSRSDKYGVVESVDHAGRTCMVRWMTPYQVGRGNRPDESITAEEVSVYDIKDHPDYKFRPGHVVVRVGGFEENHSEAAGQVYQLENGRILVQWADNSFAYCYPQELYLFDDELMSDLEGSDYSDSSETDLEDSEHSDASWETEGEESLESADSDADPDEEKEEQDNLDEDLSIEPERKVELDQLMEKARSTLEKLEETFAQNVDLGPFAVQCYKDILHIYRNCKELDKILGSSYFEEPKLQEVITRIKKELKKEKTAKIARQVLELFECNQAGGRAVEGENQERSSDRTGCELSETVAKPDCASNALVAHGLGECDKSVSLAESQGDEEPEKRGLLAENGVTCPKGTLSDGVTDLMSMEKQLKAKDQGESPEKLENKENIEGTTGGATGLDSPPAETKAQTDESPDNSKKTCRNTSSFKARDLCQSSCKCLRQQIAKVQENLEKRWQRIQDAKKTLEEGRAARNEFIDTLPECQRNEIRESDKNEPAVVGSVCSESKTAMNTQEEEEEAAQEREVAEAAAAAAQLLSPQTPETPLDVRKKIEFNVDGFSMCENAPQGHRYISNEHQPAEPKSFFAAVKKELKLLHTSLPKGIYVKSYEDRMDLFTVMILGPAKTPYEDGLFFFDVQLPDDYPTSPPSFFYLSFCSDRLNPNLYEDGKVCVSLLGTWAGKGTEVWTSKSNLLQVLISLQGLILVGEPYYNEAGYEKQKGTQQGVENSRMYNEMAILKLLQSMIKMAVHPPEVFEKEVKDHMMMYAPRMIRRLESWLALSASTSKTTGMKLQPSSEASGNPTQASSSGSEAAASPSSQDACTLQPSCSSGTEQASSSTDSGRLEAALVTDGESGEASVSYGASGDDALPGSRSEQKQKRTREADSGSAQETKSAEQKEVASAEGQQSQSVSPAQSAKQDLRPAFIPLAASPVKNATSASDLGKPDFPLLPASKGFCITLRKAIAQFKSVLKDLGLDQQVGNTKHH